MSPHARWRSPSPEGAFRERPEGWSPHARWRSLPPEGAFRERPGRAGSAAPWNFAWAA